MTGLRADMAAWLFNMFYGGTANTGSTIRSHYTTSHPLPARQSSQKSRKCVKGLGKLICPLLQSRLV
jgi:hypothetical protein